jgi:hypothetical protein
MAQGGLMFYGREKAEKRCITEFYCRAPGSEVAKKDLFALHLEEHEQLRKMYVEAEHEDSYYQDQSVFGDGISIKDTMGVLVKYASGAFSTYSLTAYAPWEGFRAIFNGTKWRLEFVTSTWSLWNKAMSIAQATRELKALCRSVRSH